MSEPTGARASLHLAHLGGVVPAAREELAGSSALSPAYAPNPQLAEDDDEEARKERAKKERADRRAKRAKKRDDDDDGSDDPNEDDEDEEEEDAKAASVTGRARARERRRCAAIFAAATESGVRNAGHIAAHFAFGTRMSRQAAIRALRATLDCIPKGTAGRGLDARMASEDIPVVQADGGERRPSSLADRVKAAQDKARGRAA